MGRSHLLHVGRSPILWIVVLLIIASSIVFAGRGLATKSGSNAASSERRPTGFPQLVSVEPMAPSLSGEMCEWPPAGSVPLLAALQQKRPTAR